MSVAHAHDGLVYVQSLARQSTKAEAVHDGIVGLVDIHVVVRIDGVRNNAVGKAFLQLVVAETCISIRAHSGGDVQWTCPVGVGKHFQHHQVRLDECRLAGKRDDHLVGDGVLVNLHSTLENGVLVDSKIDSVGRYHVQSLAHLLVGTEAVELLEHALLLSGEVVAHPVFKDVLQLVRIITEDSLGLLRIVLVQVVDIIFHVRIDTYVLVSSGDILQTAPCDWRRFGIVGRAQHLVDIPVGRQVAEVADAELGALAFYLLVVPQREGVVVAVGEDDSVALRLQTHEVVASEVAACVAV